MKKKVVSLLAAMALAVTALAGCGSNDAATTGTDAATVAATTEAAGTTEATGTTEAATDSEAVTGVKAGFIFLHDENSTYDLNFLNAAKAACEKLGIEYMTKTNIPEGQEAYEAACELADAGCNFIFADSFGHEDYIIEAAKEYPNVQFSHATGTKAHTEGLDNFHNAFASIYDGRYLAGIVAGMKLNEMIANGDITEDQAKMGYVGAYTYAEVMSGYTSFFLGARSVCPSVTMKVQFDETAEKEGANKLIQDGCVLISQHADSMGAPTACETAGVPNVSYNGSTEAACPNTFLVSSRVNWEPYFEYAIKCVADGTPIDTDWCGTLETGSVELSDLGAAVAEGTAEAVEAANKDDVTQAEIDQKTEALKQAIGNLKKADGKDTGKDNNKNNDNKGNGQNVSNNNANGKNPKGGNHKNVGKNNKNNNGNAAKTGDTMPVIPIASAVAAFAVIAEIIRRRIKNR